MLQHIMQKCRHISSYGPLNVKRCSNICHSTYLVLSDTGILDTFPRMTMWSCSIRTELILDGTNYVTPFGAIHEFTPSLYIITEFVSLRTTCMFAD